MIVRELVTKWGFDIDDKPLKAMDGHLKGLLTLTAMTGAAFGVLSAAAYGMFHLAEASAEAYARTSDFAQSLGLTVKGLRGMEFAAKMSKSSIEDVHTGLRILSRNANAAFMGSTEASVGFMRMGVSLTGADGKMRKADELMLALSDKFKKMPDGMQKTAMAMQLFGRGGASLIPMLNKGGEELRALAAQGQKYADNTNNMSEKSEKFLQAQTRIQAAIGHVKETIGSAFLPVLTELLEKLAKWYDANMEIISTNIIEALGQIIPLLRTMTDLFLGAADAGLWLVDMLGGGANAVDLLAAAFAGFAVISIIQNFGAIIGVLRTLYSVIMQVAFAEGLATGGMSLLAGLAVGGAVFGGMKYMESQNEAVPTAKGGAKSVTNNTQIAPVMHFDLRGAGAGTADKVANAVDGTLRRANKAHAAASVAGAN